MSKRRENWRLVYCGQKDKIPNMELAAAIAHRMFQRRSEPVRAYKCPYCGFYHVGGVQKGRKK